MNAVHVHLVSVSAMELYRYIALVGRHVYMFVYKHSRNIHRYQVKVAIKSQLPIIHDYT